MKREQAIEFARQFEGLDCDSQFDYDLDNVLIIINKIYDDFEQQLNSYMDFRHEIQRIHDEQVNQLEQQLADYKKRIEELEAPKSCADCLEATQSNMAFCDCTYFGRVKVNHYCSFFEPKDKQ